MVETLVIAHNKSLVRDRGTVRAASVRAVALAFEAEC